MIPEPPAHGRRGGFGPAADGSDRFDIDTQFYREPSAIDYTKQVPQRFGGGLIRLGDR